MKCIILIAAPAAGKGTISKYIEDKYNYKHISTGDLLREEVRKNTIIGKEIKPLLEKGSLVGDDIIEEVFKKEFKKTKSNIILDGIPRTLTQAKMLDNLDEEYDNVDITKVINIDIDKNIAIERIESRLICEDCGSVYNKKIIKDKVCTKCGGNLSSRNDDNKETFLDRYDTFIKQTKPLLDYYGDKVVTIYNNTSLEDVYESVDKILKGDE
ncbi:MAG: nucleoside monophosphate kinase [Bacilli bacterium]|nr:nucleoside monophosphate kinase [Bacilli bacterium]